MKRGYQFFQYGVTATVLVVPFIAVAAPEDINSVPKLIAYVSTKLLEPIVGVLFVLATIVFIWGVIQYVVGSQGNEQQLVLGKKVMVWGIIGMFIMASSWGVVKILCEFFGTCPSIQFPK